MKSHNTLFLLSILLLASCSVPRSLIEGAGHVQFRESTAALRYEAKAIGKVSCRIGFNARVPSKNVEACENDLKNKAHQMGADFVIINHSISVLGTSACPNCIRMSGIAYRSLSEEESLAIIEAYKDKDPLARELANKREVRNNIPGVRPSSQDILRATELLSVLEAAASQSLQTDPFSPYQTKLEENASPLFVLDEVTGKLTIRLTDTVRRELMLRHVEDVQYFYFRVSGSVGDTIKKINTNYGVSLDMGKGDPKVILVDRGDIAKYWQSSLVIKAQDEEMAKEIESNFEALVEIYKQ